MKLSTMVEENITSEEVEIIEEKKKCKKKKKLMEEGMKYCAKCGAEYDEALEACPSCEATETFSKCESIELRIAKKEAQLTAGSSEDEATLTASIDSLKARKESECEEEEASEEDTKMPMEEAKEGKSDILLEEKVTCADCGTEYGSEEGKCPKCGSTKTKVEETEVVQESKENAPEAIAKVETIISNIKALLNIGQEAQANGVQPPQGFDGAQEQLRKTLETLKTMKAKVETKVAESEEVIAEADILVETPSTDEETSEIAYFKSLSGQ